LLFLVYSDQEALIRGDWERMNTAITIQPHVRKKMPPRQLLPFPWEEGKKKAESREVPAEEAMKRFLSLVERTSSVGEHPSGGEEEPKGCCPDA
jgi:hypothetical protein